MKTTIKTRSRQILVQPSALEKGKVAIAVFPNPMDELGISITMTQDQIGALIFALEQAAEAAQMADRRVAA